MTKVCKDCSPNILCARCAVAWEYWDGTAWSKLAPALGFLSVKSTISKEALEKFREECKKMAKDVEWKSFETYGPMTQAEHIISLHNPTYEREVLNVTLPGLDDLTDPSEWTSLSPFNEPFERVEPTKTEIKCPRCGRKNFEDDLKEKNVCWNCGGSVL